MQPFRFFFFSFLMANTEVLVPEMFKVWLFSVSFLGGGCSVDAGVAPMPSKVYNMHLCKGRTECLYISIFDI